MRLHVRVSIGIFLVASVVSMGSHAVRQGYDTTVAIISSNVDEFGGCSAFLVPGIPSSFDGSFGACHQNWVTFDCDNNFAAAGNTKSKASTAFSQAQVGFITQKKVFIAIESSQSKDGYCWATRVDVDKATLQ